MCQHNQFVVSSQTHLKRHTPNSLSLHHGCLQTRMLSSGFSCFHRTSASPLATAVCSLNLSGSNATLVASLCSNRDDRGKCCRYINAFIAISIAISIAQYANATGNLGVPPDLSNTCLDFISQTLQLHGVPQKSITFCGLGIKIPVNFECKGRTTVTQMVQSPEFPNVMKNCQVPLSGENNCKKCINPGIVYRHHLLGTETNITFNTCRDATFPAVASQVDFSSAVAIASCLFQVQGLSILPVLETCSCS